MRVYRISNLPEQLQTQEKFTVKKRKKKSIYCRNVNNNTTFSDKNN